MLDERLIFFNGATVTFSRNIPFTEENYDHLTGNLVGN
jgi:hypothetical protein